MWVRSCAPRATRTKDRCSWPLQHMAHARPRRGIPGAQPPCATLARRTDRWPHIGCPLRHPMLSHGRNGLCIGIRHITPYASNKSQVRAWPWTNASSLNSRPCWRWPLASGPLRSPLGSCHAPWHRQAQRGRARLLQTLPMGQKKIAPAWAGAISTSQDSGQRPSCPLKLRNSRSFIALSRIPASFCTACARLLRTPSALPARAAITAAR